MKRAVAYKKIISVILVMIMALGVSIDVCATSVSNYNLSTETSGQYRNSSQLNSRYRYYYRFVTNINKYCKDPNYNHMERAYRLARSQLDWNVNKSNVMSIGYNNYRVDKSGTTHWEGNVLRNSTGCANTEYTRWFFTKFKDTKYGSNAAKTNCDWCAIFVSWCMYFSGYRKGYSDMTKVYSYSADPGYKRIYDSKAYTHTYDRLESFNIEPRYLYYTKRSFTKIRQSWDNEVSLYNRLIDLGYHVVNKPQDIPYKPGGLVFFNWSGDNKTFDHVGIVSSYNKKTQILTYISGNDNGRVQMRSIALNESQKLGTYTTLNSNRIMAYGEYYGYGSNA